MLPLCSVLSCIVQTMKLMVCNIIYFFIKSTKKREFALLVNNKEAK